METISNTDTTTPKATKPKTAYSYKPKETAASAYSSEELTERTERVEKAPAKASDTKTIFVPRDPSNPSAVQIFEYNLNGTNYIIRRGVNVELKASVADNVMRKLSMIGVYSSEVESFRNKSKNLQN